MALLDRRVARVVHCDWGKDAKKRRMAIADRGTGDSWSAGPVSEVGDLATLLARVRAGVRDDGAILVGFDFPIGVPLAYARAANVDGFVPLLRDLGRGRWSLFFDVCRATAEIGLHRPFYPMNSKPKGTVSPAHLLAALGLDRGALLRECDRLTGAGSLFWTLGAKQVGKGALVGWEKVLAPSVGSVRLWPFEGRLSELLDPGVVVIAETYPAAFYTHLGIEVVKSDRARRAKVAPALEPWALANNVEFDPALLADMRNGFGTDDDFDAAIGALGMINVLRGGRDEGWPPSDEVRRVEGWILGA